MIGIRAGIVAGVRAGIVAGVNADDVGPGDPLASVARDAASGWYFPASSAQWTTLLTVAGITSGGPVSGYGCQDASPGPLDDFIGATDLAQSGAGHLYQQALAGFTRLALRTTDGTANQKWINSTTAPDPNATSTLYLAAIGFPELAPAAARCLFANGGTLDCRLAAATGRITIVNGASTTGTVPHLDDTHLVLLQRNRTASTFTAYTTAEKIVGTFGAVASNPMFVLAGQTAAAALAFYPYAAVFSGAAAEITSTQAKSLIATMTGITPPWAP